MLPVLLFFATLTPTTPIVPRAGGEIFGDVRAGTTYVANAPLQVTCGADVAKTQTDSTGSFRVRTKEVGKCQLTVTFKGQSPSLEVVVFAQATKYRILVEEKDGKFTLKRA